MDKKQARNTILEMIDAGFSSEMKCILVDTFEVDGKLDEEYDVWVDSLTYNDLINMFGADCIIEMLVDAWNGRD